MNTWIQVWLKWPMPQNQARSGAGVLSSGGLTATAVSIEDNRYSRTALIDWEDGDATEPDAGSDDTTAGGDTDDGGGVDLFTALLAEMAGGTGPAASQPDPAPAAADDAR